MDFSQQAIDLIYSLTSDPRIVVAIISVLPFIELRGGIPVGIVQFGLDPVSVFLYACAANIAIIPFLYKFLDWFFDLLGKTPLNRFIEKTHRKAHPYVKRYGLVGLTLFVSVPAPGTGAYTGALAAHIFGMKNKRSMACVALGVVLAGVVVTVISTIFRQSMGFLVGL